MPLPPPADPPPWAHGGLWDRRNEHLPSIHGEALPVDPQHTSPLHTSRDLLTTRIGASFDYHDRNSGPLSGQQRPFRVATAPPHWLDPSPWPPYEAAQQLAPMSETRRRGRKGITPWAAPPATPDGLPLDPLQSARVNTAVGSPRQTRHGAARRYQQSQVGIVVFGNPLGRGAGSTHAAAGQLPLPRAFGLLPSSIHTYQATAEELHRLSRHW
mmetsp:Transcript_45089/g.125045  ORF Transcript_45089/g.125045 Transcript_45089/m.125045 type:complete len:213 (+) Transcript_45089:89-727(+)